MKIDDIPQLIYCGSNGVSLDLDYIHDMLERFRSSYGLDLDPEFQRDHVWNMETKIKFLEYILRGGVVQPIRFNSPCFGGWKHEKHSDLPEDVVLVDGKQRLTACLEFIDNKIPVFGGNYLKDFDNPQLLLRKVNMSYFVNKLQTKRELYQWYLEMNEGQIAHTPEELEKVRILMKAAK
jgi:uncharacterized protein with ParB-like and HNH nuclease domain